MRFRDLPESKIADCLSASQEQNILDSVLCQVHNHRKDMRQLLPHPTEDAHCFDPWHSTPVAEEKPRPTLREIGALEDEIEYGKIDPARAGETPVGAQPPAPTKSFTPADYRHITTEDVRNCVEGKCHCDERRIVSLESEVERMRELLCVVPRAEAVPSVLSISEALPSAGESSTHKNSARRASSPAPSTPAECPNCGGTKRFSFYKGGIACQHEFHEYLNPKVIGGAPTGEGAQNGNSEVNTDGSRNRAGDNNPADNRVSGAAVVPSGGAPR